MSPIRNIAFVLLFTLCLRFSACGNDDGGTTRIIKINPSDDSALHHRVVEVVFNSVHQDAEGGTIEGVFFDGGVEVKSDRFDWTLDGTIPRIEYKNHPCARPLKWREIVRGEGDDSALATWVGPDSVRTNIFCHSGVKRISFHCV